MPWHRTTVLVLTGLLASASWLQAVDVWTVGVNNTRQGWNKFETVLTPANVPALKKIREFAVDEKIDVSPPVRAKADDANHRSTPPRYAASRIRRFS